MEEYDDLSVGPVDGNINLSHNTWKILPQELNTFSLTLTSLEMSNNQLTVIPESIGNLILLRSLNVSLNRIERIDKAIGKCIRLRRLNVENNRIECFPDEIGECILLEELLASNNRLSTLPQKIEGFRCISKIDLRNNEMVSIPFKLCRVPTLNLLLCEGNPNFGASPEKMRGNSKLLLWCLEMQQKLKEATDPILTERDRLLIESNNLKSKVVDAQDTIEHLELEIASLELERPDKYIYYKEHIMIFASSVLEKVVKLWRLVIQSLLMMWDRRKIYPLDSYN